MIISAKKPITAIIAILLLLILASLIIKDPGRDNEGMLLPGEMTVTPLPEGTDEVRFPTTEIGTMSTVEIFQIENTGQKGRGIFDVSLTGPASGNFIIQGLPENKSLGPGENITFAVYFSPQEPGTHTASLLIATELNGFKENTINVTGTAVRSFDYPLPPPRPPEPPVAVIAAFEGDKIMITWNDAPNAPLPESYNLYISSEPFPPDSEINLSGSNLPSNISKINNASRPYLHLDYSLNQTLYFAVSSQNDIGEGRLSETVSVRPSTTYYVSSLNGNDSNDGLSPKTPWRTLERVNSHQFKPGEFILFEKGTEYFGRIEVRHSGLDGLPITYGAYGEGEKPVISGIGQVPGWDDPGSWNEEGDNIWSIYYGPWKIANRLWLSGEEFMKAKGLDYIDSVYMWYAEYFADEGESIIYLYSQGNPAEIYTDIREASAFGTPFVFWSSDHITLSGLDIRGGGNNMDIISSSNLIIEDCLIGNGATMGINVVGVWTGLTGPESRSDNGIIRGSVIDSGFRFEYNYPNVQTQDGILLTDNASGWRIYGNEVRDWGHSGINLIQRTEGTVVAANHIYANYFTSEGITYGRAWEVSGEHNDAENNHFYHNLVKNTSVHIQIGGYNNYVYYNIIDTVINSPIMPYPTGSGIVLIPGVGSNNSKIFNNIIYNTESAGIVIPDWHGSTSTRYNEVYNNIIINCGWGAEETLLHAGIALTYRSHVDEPPASEFNIIKNNIVYSEYSEAVAHHRGNLLTIGQFNNKNGILGDTISENYFFNPGLASSDEGNYLPTVLFIIIDNGVTVMETFDLLGNPVPSGERADIGPYEFR